MVKDLRRVFTISQFKAPYPYYKFGNGVIFENEDLLNHNFMLFFI